jgi:hypothetical protein
MYNLIYRAMRNGAYFAELIIDQENIPSIKVAEALGLTKIKEWNRPESGQGKRNSGNFVLYYAFAHLVETEAEQYKVEPLEIIQNLWLHEAMGLIQQPKMITKRAKIGKTRMSQNLRFFSDEASHSDGD